MRLTASKLELAAACPGAFTLPWDETPTPESEAGNERHAAQEASINDGDIPAELSERWPGFTWSAEVALAYDVVTGTARLLGKALDRNYGALGPTEIAGTADAVGVLGKQLVIVDKKGFNDVTSTATNPQLRFLALAACRALSLDGCEVAITHELRPMDVASVDALDLDDMAQDVRLVHLKVTQGHAAFTTGKHCRWCPAFHACPKQSELTAMVKSGAAETRVEMQIPFADDESAADAYEFSKRLRMLLKRLDASLYARANERPIPLRNGKLFGPRETLGNERLDGDITYAVVKDLYGQSVADAAVERKATKSKLKDALRFVKEHGAMAAAERKVLAAVRKRGGSERVLTVEITEYSPQLPEKSS